MQILIDKNSLLYNDLDRRDVYHMVSLFIISIDFMSIFAEIFASTGLRKVRMNCYYIGSCRETGVFVSFNDCVPASPILQRKVEALHSSCVTTILSYTVYTVFMFSLCTGRKGIREYSTRTITF